MGTHFPISITRGYLLLVMLLACGMGHAQRRQQAGTSQQDATAAPIGARRVVIFDLSVLETFHELGIPVAGVPNTVPGHLAAYRDAKYAKLGTITKPDIAALQAFQPDLIISGGRQGSFRDSLAALAPTLTLSTDAADFWASFEANVRTIAAWYGKEALAEQKLATLRQKVETVKAKAQADSRKSVFVLHVNGRFNPNGPASRFGFGYDVLGLQAAIAEAPTAGRGARATGAAAAANEQPEGERSAPPSLATINPDYLFIIDRATGIKDSMPSLPDILNDDIKATGAYKQGKVFILPGSIWYLSGSGLTSVDKKINDIASMLYGISF